MRTQGRGMAALEKEGRFRGATFAAGVRGAEHPTVPGGAVGAGCDVGKRLAGAPGRPRPPACTMPFGSRVAACGPSETTLGWTACAAADAPQ